MKNRVMAIAAGLLFSVCLTSCVNRGLVSDDEVDLAMKNVYAAAPALAASLDVDVSYAVELLMSTQMVLHADYAEAKYKYVWHNDKTVMNRVVADCKAAKQQIAMLLAKKNAELAKLRQMYEEQQIVVYRVKKQYELYKTSGDLKSAGFMRAELIAEIEKLNSIGRKIPLPDYAPDAN